MKTTRLFGLVWSLLRKSERQRSLILGVYLIIGTVLEVLSVGVLVPLIQVLTHTHSRSRIHSLTQKFCPSISFSYSF
jgi:hypothetical protein